MAWRAIFMSMAILVLAAPALAFECPQPDRLAQQGGRWTAPNGWTQSDYQPPMAKAEIKGFAGAYYLRVEQEAWLMCSYRVRGSKARYTQLRHTAPLVNYWNREQCADRLPGFTCPATAPGPLTCPAGMGVAFCQVVE